MVFPELYHNGTVIAPKLRSISPEFRVWGQATRSPIMPDMGGSALVTVTAHQMVIIEPPAVITCDAVKPRTETRRNSILSIII